MGNRHSKQKKKNVLSREEERIQREYTSLQVSTEQNEYDSIEVVRPQTMRVRNQKGHVSNRNIVAAIDFGTTYSGLAYSLRHEIERDPPNVYMTVVREPTSVLFRPNKTFFKFGKDAEEHMNENFYGEDLTKYYFFKHFKMSLYNTKNLSKDTMLPDITEKKQLPAIDVFSSVISYFKALLENSVNSSFTRTGGSSSDMIYWVLTCPAIWNLKAKQFMREAAEMAGIDSAHLAIALEPEAASVYCRSVKLNIVKEESTYEFSTLGEGSKYLILDLGGGTVDITAHQVGHHTGLKELHQASGNDARGNRVNQQFLKFIENFIGPDRITWIKENHPSDWVEILNNFETKKCTYRPGSQIFIRLPTSFQDIFREKDVLEKVHRSSFKSEVSFVRDKVKLSRNIFRRFFAPSISSIFGHIRPILAKHVDIKQMLVVGGLAESSIVTNAIRGRFPNVKVLVPNDPRSAVLKGVIMYGFKPEIIQARVCRYTYGIAKQRPFNKETDPVEKITVHKGMHYCDDVFDKYVTLGDVVRVGEFQESKEYHPVTKKQILEFYASTEESPRLITDDSCQFLGLMEISLTDREFRNRGTVEVKLNFGGTELEIEAIEKRTGQRTKASCNFLG